MKYNPIKYLLFSLCVSFFSQPASAQDPAEPVTLVGKISIAGSDTLSNMVESWAARFTKKHPQVQFQLQASGSASAPIALIEGTALLGTMSRKMTRRERDRFIDFYGYAPMEIAIAIDALAIFVNKNNPLRGISLKQLDSIFSVTRRCGGLADITQWGSILGDPRYSGRSIKLFGRNVVSGTYGFFRNNVLCGGDFKPTINQMLGSSAVVQAVDTDELAMGYSAIGFQSSRTKALMVKDNKGVFIDASIANAVSGRYPLSRYMYLYINNPPTNPLDDLHSQFIRYILSDEGQISVRQDGYIPLSQSLRDEYLKQL